MLGTTVPLHSAEHFYVVTEAVEGTHPDLPIMRDPDGWTYFKEEVGGLVVGGFEPEAKPWRAPDDLPHPFEFQLLEEDWEHFSVLMDEAVHPGPGAGRDRHPEVLQRPRVVHARQPVPARPQPPRSTTCSSGPGFNSVGIASAGGAGRALAEWIVEGEPTGDLVGVDIRRFAPFHADRAFLRDRVAEVLGPPLRGALAQPRGRRPPATSGCRPLHDRLAAAGRGLRLQDGLGAAQRLRSGRARPRLHLGQAVVAAVVGGRAAGLPDRRSRSSTRRRSPSTPSTGPDALAALQWVCAADVDVEVGRSVYTPFLNERGTYEADVTVTRDRPDDAFLVLSSSATTVRDLDWIRRHTRGRGRGTSPATTRCSG